MVALEPSNGGKGKKSVLYSVAFTPEMWERVNQEAERVGRSKASVIRDILGMYFKALDEENGGGKENK